MSYKQLSRGGTDEAADGRWSTGAATPGKRTLTEGLPVQRMAVGAAPEATGAPAAPAVGGTIAWQDFILSADAKTVRAVLENLYATGEQPAIDSFVGSFRLHVIAKRNQKKDWELPGAASAGTTEDFADLPKLEAILAVLEQQNTALAKVVATYLATVDQTAWDLAHQLLDESEKSITAEKKRYGIREEGENAATGAPVYGMDSNADTVGLTSAAATLAKLTDDIENASADKDNATEKKWSAGLGGEVTVITNSAAYDDAERRLARARKDLSILRPELESKYPILAAFTSKEQLAKLRVGDLSAKAMGAEISDKLANIVKARDLFADGKAKPMGLDRVAGLTRTKLAPAEGSVQAKVLERRAADGQVKDEPLIPAWLKTVLQVAFSILSVIPATAPIGIAGEGALAALSLPDLIHKFQIESDMATMGGTDFGSRALAVAAEDPSLTWLAFELLAAGVAAYSAVQVFRQLAIPARRVMSMRPTPAAAPTPGAGATTGAAAASSTEEVLRETEEALRKSGNDVKPGLGNKLVEEANHRKVLTAAGEELTVALRPAGTLRPVLAEEIQVLYLKGKLGDSADVDALAAYLQELTARKATELRAYAEALANAGGRPLADVIPGFETLSPSLKAFLRQPSPATFGTALQMAAEPEITAAGLKKLYGLVYRKQFRGIPDIQAWPGGGDTGGVIFDWTTPGQAGKALKEYDWDSVDFIVEVIQPGP